MENKKQNKSAFSMQLDVSDFLPAEESEKESLVIMREPRSFFKDGMSKLLHNPVSVGAIIVLIAIFIYALVLPMFWPYSYEEQIRGSEKLAPMEYSEEELVRMESGENVFPHILGTDSLGRDYMVRTMIGARISIMVGVIASVLILIIGSIYGTCAGYFGGKIDMIMMRIVDVIYTVPDTIIIIMLAATMKHPIKKIAETYEIVWMHKVGVNMICIFAVFALLYWVGMARIVRSQVLIIKEQEFVTAAKALGAKSGRIIRKHLLTNCIDTLIVTTTLQIPSSIFIESFLSFIGLGVNAPMPSLGSLASDAISGIRSYPHRLLAPALLISLIILAFNLLGDGLREAFDSELKK